MRKLILSLTMLIACYVQAAASFPADWPRYCALTIDHTKVTASQTGFPVLVAYRTTADTAVNLPDECMLSGGTYSARSDGGDLRFTTGSDGSGTLHSEVVTFVQANPVSGASAEIWVKCDPSSTVDTVIYAWYGCGSATAPAANNATWGSQGVHSAYKAVWHMKETGTNPQIKDSTANGHDSSTNVWTPSTGYVGGTASMNGSSQYFAIPSSADFEFGSGDFTIIWNEYYTSGGDYQLLCRDGAAANYATLLLRADAGCFIGSTSSAWDILNGLSLGGSSANTWVQYALMRSGNTFSTYKDGSFVASATSSAYIAACSNAMQIAKAQGGYYFTGKLDEICISKTALGADWIHTAKHNQNSPSTFITVGTPQSNGGTPATGAAGFFGGD